jgi:hypothetical protein
MSLSYVSLALSSLESSGFSLGYGYLDLASLSYASRALINDSLDLS